MENTNTTTPNTAAAVDALFAPTPSLAEVLNTGDMDIPPHSQRNNEAPFANLEEQRIRNACKRDREFQDNICRQHNKAHEIIKMYYGGSLLFEDAVTLLMTECHRDRTCAIINIENSPQRFIFC